MGEPLNSSSLWHSCQKIILNNTFKVSQLTSSQFLLVVLNIYWGCAGIDNCPRVHIIIFSLYWQMSKFPSCGNIDRFIWPTYNILLLYQIDSEHSILYHEVKDCIANRKTCQSIIYLYFKIDSFPLAWLFWRMWSDHKTEMS